MKQRVLYGGFTMIELLMVIALIGILIGMLMPVISNSRAKAKSVHCMSNLRQIGTSIALYTTDHDNRLFLYSMLEDQTKSWATRLNLAKEGNREVFLCPTYPPYTFDPTFQWWLTYGVRRDPPPEYLENAMAIDLWLKVDSIERPTDYLHITDTTSNGRMGIAAQQFYYWDMTETDQVHARHNEDANGLFIDGHVEACDRRRLESLGIQALYGLDAAPGYYGP